MCEYYFQKSAKRCAVLANIKNDIEQFSWNHCDVFCLYGPKNQEICEYKIWRTCVIQFNLLRIIYIYSPFKPITITSLNNNRFIFKCQITIKRELQDENTVFSCQVVLILFSIQVMYHSSLKNKISG